MILSRLSLLGGISAYFVSSLGAMAIVKFLNYKAGFSSWAIFAMVSRSAWIPSLCLHGFLQKWEGVALPRQSRTQVALYFGIAIGLAIVELCNALSLTVLPGSWYALMKGSDIGFSMVLSRLFLAKRYRWGQIHGSFLVMGGIAIAFLLGNSSDHLPKETVGLVSIPVALAVCMFAAFLDASLAVLTEATLKRILKVEEERLPVESNVTKVPSKLLLSNVYSMWTAFFSFTLLVPVVFLSGQFREGLDVLQSSVQEPTNDTAMISSSKLPMVLILSLSFLGISRFTARLSKYWICVVDSAVTFSLVQAARRLSGVFVIAFLFNEGFPLQMLIGSLFSGVGFALHYWSGLETEKGAHGGAHQYELVSTNTSGNGECSNQNMDER